MPLIVSKENKDKTSYGPLSTFLNFRLYQEKNLVL